MVTNFVLFSQRLFPGVQKNDGKFFQEKQLTEGGVKWNNMESDK